MVIGLVECPSCHTRVIPMSPDNRCPSCQELIPSPETYVTTDHVLKTPPESFLSSGAHSHDKWSNGCLDTSGSPSTAQAREPDPEGNAEQLLVKAIKLEAKGRYDESCRLYQRILNDFPSTEVAQDAKTRFDNLRIDIEGEVGTRETIAPVSSETLFTIRKTDNETPPRKSALDVSRMAFVPKQLGPIAPNIFESPNSSGQIKQETSISVGSSTRKSNKLIAFISWVIALFVGSMVYQYLKPHVGVLAMFAGGFVAYVLQAFVFGYLAAPASATRSGRVLRSAHTSALMVCLQVMLFTLLAWGFSALYHQGEQIGTPLQQHIRSVIMPVVASIAPPLSVGFALVTFIVASLLLPPWWQSRFSDTLQYDSSLKGATSLIWGAWTGSLFTLVVIFTYYTRYLDNIWVMTSPPTAEYGKTSVTANPCNSLSESESATKHVLAKAEAMLREHPGPGYKYVRPTKEGERYAVVGTDGDWLQVCLAENIVAWIHNTDVMEDGTPSPASESSETTSDIKYIMPMKAGINLRKGPGTSHGIIWKSKQGDKYQVVGEKGNWLRVRLLGNQEGWISKAYVRVIEEIGIEAPAAAMGLEKPEPVGTLRKLSQNELFERITTIVQESRQTSSAKQAQFSREMQQLEVHEMLTASTLTSKQGIAQNRVKLRKWASLFQRQLDASQKDLAWMREQVSKLATTYAGKAELWQLYNKGVENRHDLEKKIIANKKAGIAAVTKLNDFMASKLGKAIVKDGQLLFRTGHEIQTYNELTAVLSRQAEIENQLQKQYHGKLEELEKIIPEKGAEVH